MTRFDWQNEFYEQRSSGSLPTVTGWKYATIRTKSFSFWLRVAYWVYSRNELAGNSRLRFSTSYLKLSCLYKDKNLVKKIYFNDRMAVWSRKSANFHQNLALIMKKNRSSCFWKRRRKANLKKWVFNFSDTSTHGNRQLLSNASLLHSSRHLIRKSFPVSAPKVSFLRPMIG